MESDCPFGSSDCPKIEELERRVDAMETTMNRILYAVYFVAGIVSVELGIVII